MCPKKGPIQGGSQTSGQTSGKQSQSRQCTAMRNTCVVCMREGVGVCVFILRADELRRDIDQLELEREQLMSKMTRLREKVDNDPQVRAWRQWLCAATACTSACGRCGCLWASAELIRRCSSRRLTLTASCAPCKPCARSKRRKDACRTGALVLSPSSSARAVACLFLPTQL